MKNSILKSKAFKLTSVILAVLVLGVSIMAIVTNGFRNWGRNDIVPPVIDGGFVTDDNGNDLSDNEVHPMPKNMMFRASAVDGQKSDVTLNATIEPADAADQRVIWSVDWVNPNDEFAKGKNAASYLSVSPVEEYSLTVIVSCSAAFGSQIVITVASVENPDATATCIVDYMRRLESLSLKVGQLVDGSISDPELLLENGETGNLTFHRAENPGTLNREFSIVGNWGVGTIDDMSGSAPEANTSLEFRFSEEFAAALLDSGFPIQDTSFFTVAAPYVLPFDQSFVDSYFGSFTVEQRNMVMSIMGVCETALDVVATFTGPYGEISATFHFHVDSQLGAFVTGITLDESTLVI